MLGTADETLSIDEKCMANPYSALEKLIGRAENVDVRGVFDLCKFVPISY